MDIFSASGGFLEAFVLVGILLPIVGSFVIDGVVHWVRGRSPRLLIISAVLTLAILGLFAVAWENGIVEATGTTDANSIQNLTGATGLILCLSIPVALIGFALRMVALFLNPTTKAADQALIAARRKRHEAKLAKRMPAPVGVARAA